MDAMKSAVFSLAEKQNFENWRVSGNELKVTGVCPLCGGGDHGDRDTFSINVSTGAWNCKRGGCTGINGKHEGSFRELCNYFGEEAPVGFTLPKQTKQQKKSYTKPDPEMLKPITEEIETFFATRRISESTLKDWKIAADSEGNIVFPFYRDYELVFVKYRQPKKYTTIKDEYEKKLKDLKPGAEKPKKPMKEWRLPNTESILFGMDMVDYNRPLVITEGQIDALSIYEAGYSNVVSVPSGCEDLNWINNCWEFLEKFNQFILFGDNDEPGLEMISTLSKRLGEDRCMIPQEYPEMVYNGKDYNKACKDANEILICYGPEYLKGMIDSCEPAPVKGVLELSKVQFVDPTLIPRIMTRIPKLDNMCGGLGEGGITIVSGKRGEGRHLLSINMVN